MQRSGSQSMRPREEPSALGACLRGTAVLAWGGPAGSLPEGSRIKPTFLLGAILEASGIFRSHVSRKNETAALHQKTVAHTGPSSASMSANLPFSPQPQSLLSCHPSAEQPETPTLSCLPILKIPTRAFKPTPGKDGSSMRPTDPVASGWGGRSHA